jgi:Ca2+-binding RTX toxin-like protein
MRGWSGRVAVGSVAITSAVLGLPVGAGATVPTTTCSYDSGTHTVTADINDDATAGFSDVIEPNSHALEVAIEPDNGDPATFVPCTGATDSNTTTIVVTNSAANNNIFFLEQFTPGMHWQVDLGDGADELSLIAGQHKTLRLGSLGADLDNTGTVTATFAGVEELDVDGRFASTAVTLSAAGGNGTGAAYSHGVLLFGGPGNDTLLGGTGNDVITGESGNDVENGGAGNDELGSFDTAHGFGDAGRNHFSGGPGRDYFSDDDGFGIVSYAADSKAVNVSLDGLGNDGVAHEHDNVNASISEVIGGHGNDVISASSGAASAAGVDYTLVGGGGADTLTGGPNDDLIEGGSGADVLSGRNGRDDIRGSSGNDKLYGGDGVDGLDGGTGTDRCAGGAGADVFEHCEHTS